MAATERDKLEAQRMREIYAALRAKYLEYGTPDTGLPVAQFVMDETTRNALWWLLTKERHVEIRHGMVHLTDAGFNQAFRLEEQDKSEDHEEQDFFFG